jgi:hypothetical protein
VKDSPGALGQALPVGAPPPIFVVAPPGLPVETVAAMLGQHPECWGMPEINLELSGNLDSLMREMIGLRSSQMHGLLRTLSQLLTGEQTIIGVDAARRWLSRYAYLPTSAVWHLLAQRVGPRRMVAPLTATLFEAGSLGRLVATFPEAKFVALKMHPKSHGEAVMAQHGGAAAWLLGALDETVEPAMPEPSEIWQLAEAGLDDLAGLVRAKQIIPVRVEDLVHNTKPTLTRLLKKLDLAAPPRVLAAMQRPESSSFRGRGPFGAQFGGEILTLEALRSQIPSVETLTLEGRAPWRPDGMPLGADIRLSATKAGYR